MPKISSNLVNYSLWTKNRYFGQLPKTVVQSTTNMDHNNMVYQMELRLSFSQQLAKGLRDGGHQLTDLYVIGYGDCIILEPTIA